MVVIFYTLQPNLMSVLLQAVVGKDLEYAMVWCGVVWCGVWVSDKHQFLFLTTKVFFYPPTSNQKFKVLVMDWMGGGV